MSKLPGQPRARHNRLTPGRLLRRAGLIVLGVFSSIAIGAGLVASAAVRLVGRQKPAPAEEPGALPAPRRRFLKWGGFTLAGLAGAATAVPIVGWIFPDIEPRDDEWTDAGPVDAFPQHFTQMAILHNKLLQPWAGATDKVPVYVKRGAGNEFKVLSVHCSHLGCPLSWFKESGLFMCPCHGGVFYADGTYASGPPPRNMYELAHRIRHGRLQVKVGHFPVMFRPGSAGGGE
jgi:menaquinol-cytochrome c reductase iron-sulfur subunit